MMTFAIVGVLWILAAVLAILGRREQRRTDIEPFVIGPWTAVKFGVAVGVAVFTLLTVVTVTGVV